MKLISNYLLQMTMSKWLNIFFILTMMLSLSRFNLAEVNLITKEPQDIDEVKSLPEVTASGTLTTTSQSIIDKNINNPVNEDLTALKRKCFTSNFRLLLKENRNQLRKLQIEYRKLRYLTTSTAERMRLFDEYKTKVKNLRQEFLLKTKEIKEDCQSKFGK